MWNYESLLIEPGDYPPNWFSTERENVMNETRDDKNHHATHALLFLWVDLTCSTLANAIIS